MNKFALALTIILLTSTKFHCQKLLYTDKNNVNLKVNIVRTDMESECTNTKEKVIVWKLDWIVENNSSKTIRSNNAQIATGFVDLPMSPVETTNCTLGLIRTNSTNPDNFPFIGFKRHTNYHIKPSETIQTSWYYYSHPDKKPVLQNWQMHPYKFIENKKKRKENDFWSGGKDEVNNKLSNKKDDFWSGGKNQDTDKNIRTNFWNGKGSKQEEVTFQENTKADESDTFIGNVRSRTKSIRIFCIDSGEEDGDLVRISNNGVILKENIYLTNVGNSYWFDLEFGQNRIEILALNQGSVGANTASFKVFDENGREIAEQNWHLKSGYKGTLLILKI